MYDEFTEIIKYLQLRKNTIEGLVQDVINLCKTKGGVAQAIRDLKVRAEEYDSDVRTYEYVPTCNMLLAYAYYCYGDFPEAVVSAREAAEKYDICDQQWNRALALWGRGLAFQEDCHLNQALDSTCKCNRLF